MARILRHESSLSRQRRALETELRRTPWLRPLVWTPALLVALFALLAHSLSVPARVALAVLPPLLAFGYEWRLREIAAESKFLEGGRSGERRLADRFADQLADDHLILNDLDLRIAHERFQIDHLILAPSGIWIVESKYWAGTLSGDVADRTWLQTRPRRPSVRVKSPLFQVLRQRDMFLALFNTGLPEEHVHALAVFTHPHVTLDISRNRDQALLIKAAIRLLNDRCFDPPVWTPEAMQALADRILATQS